MEYNKLVAVSGLPGLFELISSKNDGAIVRSLIDKTTKFASSRIHQFSHLESIEIYTVRDNVNLVDVFNAMKAAGTALPDTKDDKAIKAYFEKVYPDMDFERVYTSDMKKMVKWFDILQKNNVEIKLTSQPETEDEPVEEEVKEAKTEPAKKPAAKSKAEKTGAAEEKAEKKEKAPAKKTAVKKAAPKKTTASEGGKAE
ncbi:hypothetical protein A8C56_19705 [Niabella ginsenosidivorans]|uniref:Uncharacterized protein n=1 Tax=Niabella ginsenosidivorans TaxID=1176587 RepID=A0A1A9I5T9_9BACT|nr:DUF5606 domain-containing protein [Niabella ginsenosidivorans]ANH82913.1 hypothetical protein A8C56_19705 [Niabella ginsenosidivorans]